MHLLNASHFSMSWWRLDLAFIRIPKSLNLKKPTAITLNSVSTQEFKIIKEYCDANGIFKITHPGYYTETYYCTIVNDHEVLIEFSNNERTIIAEESDIEKLERFLETMPQKEHAIFLEIDTKELRKLTKGYNVRIIKDSIKPLQKVLLIDNNALAFELILRCD